MTEKNKNNPWQEHLKKVREENKGKRAKEIFKIAKESYKNGK
jgi:hypothetical protein